MLQIMAVIEKTSIKTVLRGEEGYPFALEKLNAPPESLRVVGELGQGPAVAMVGSRKADNTSIKFAFSLAKDLASMGVRIVSGGAAGIDTAAHKGALEAGGHTVAVIGSGFEFLYPAENKSLFEKIAEEGALVSEFDDRQPPTKWTFPKRNRIVAALSDAVVTVQAGERSGALITAKVAAEIGVPVGAVPSSPQDPKNRGNLNLLRRGAALVEDVNDVLQLISTVHSKTQLSLPGMDAEKSKNSHSSPVLPDLSETERKVLNYLCTGPLHIDEISAGLSLPPSETGSVILTLELKGLIEDRGGRHFVKVG
jgi:DNA processing protein